MEHLVEVEFHDQKIWEVCNGDLNFAKKILDLFMQQTQLAHSELMQQRMELDKEKNRMIFHCMKSTLGCMGLEDLRQAAIQLELLSKAEVPKASDIEDFSGALRDKMSVF